MGDDNRLAGGLSAPVAWRRGKVGCTVQPVARQDITQAPAEGPSALHDPFMKRGGAGDAGFEAAPS